MNITLDIPLKLYVIRDSEGRFLRTNTGKRYNPDSCWDADINKAKMYTKIAPARAQVTGWAISNPTRGIPELVELTVGSASVIDDVDETKRKLRKRRIKKLKMQISHTQYAIGRYYKNNENEPKWLAEQSKRLDDLQAELASL